MSTASPEAKSKVRKQPPLLLALVPFICLIAIMLPSVIILGADPQIPLIICTAVTSVIAICFLGRGWQEIEDSMIETNTMAMQANFIIMIVGCLVATWIAGGIVPGMIYYGLKLFSPSVFLALLPVICAIIAVSTGSAWTTAGTMGAAAMGIAAGLGIPPAIAAGAVVTGASFGDKLSPLSDSTNLAAGVAGTKLFDHVRHMLYSHSQLSYRSVYLCRYRQPLQRRFRGYLSDRRHPLHAGGQLQYYTPHLYRSPVRHPHDRL